MVEHHFGGTAFAEDPVNFDDSPDRVRRVMQHSVGIDDVKALRRKWQPFAVGDHESAVLAVECETVTRYLNRARSQINASAECTATRKLQEIGAHSAADFEQLRTGMLVEPHQARHPRRVLTVAIAF